MNWIDSTLELVWEIIVIYIKFVILFGFGFYCYLLCYLDPHKQEKEELDTSDIEDPITDPITDRNE